MSDGTSGPKPVERSFHNPHSGYKWHTLELSRWDGSASESGPRVVKVIEHPGAYLLASMRLDANAVNEYLDDHEIETFTPWGLDGHEVPNHINARNDRGSDQELLVELSGRICYMSYDRPRPGGVGAFLDRLKSEGHGSVFEHPHYSVLLTGVSRNMTLEGNRHRPFSISQLSGRFVDAAQVGFVVDPELMGNLTHRIEWAHACRDAFEQYETTHARNFERHLQRWRDKIGDPFAKPDKPTERKLIKKARERARDILPGCLETRLVYTVNARAIRFVFEKRCHADAAFEIRRAFNLVYRLIKERDPKLFSDYTEEPLDDGTFAVKTDFGKV